MEGRQQLKACRHALSGAGQTCMVYSPRLLYHVQCMPAQAWQPVSLLQVVVLRLHAVRVMASFTSSWCWPLHVLKTIHVHCP